MEANLQKCIISQIIDPAAAGPVPVPLYERLFLRRYKNITQETRQNYNV